MRYSWLALALVLGCGNGTTKTDMATGSGDMSSLPTLTVNNTLSWCTVTVTVGTGSPVSFTDPTKTFIAPSGTLILLKAEPLATFKPVKWTGVTTTNADMGDLASYTMTSAAAQSLTACCALSTGTGC
jgi:hypothetical protein